MSNKKRAVHFILELTRRQSAMLWEDVATVSCLIAVPLLSVVSIAVYASVVECGKRKGRKSLENLYSLIAESNKWSDLNVDRDDQMEDTFEFHKPKIEEAKRAKDIKDAKAFNAGDYKTWNKLMNDDNDFEKPIQKEGEKKSK
ncbi:hypothetical protein TELCIR_12169 [Teladorsagia circumcincta]|uniref:Uncharacterized protein n=1 Tax=Teladorsagia circumcincta TaxID=45464 RepID=A0A2G9U779_TELCI|nr:hypothetical protein TELCIR_12169 [Teladorsagia circumcincta]